MNKTSILGQSRIFSKQYLCMGLVLSLGALVQSACSDDEPGPGNPPLDRGGTLDQFKMPDTGPLIDQAGLPKYDGLAGDGKKLSDGSDGAKPSDLGADGASACTVPSGAKCATACTTGQLCTPAKGGLCAAEVKLIGPASNKPVLLGMAEAYASCWQKNPSVDTLCSTLNTCAMTGTITPTMVKDWVCNVAKSADFSSTKAFDAAKDVCGCSGIPGFTNTDWKITNVTGTHKGQVCLTFDNGLLKDYVHINDCSKFPPI